MNQQERSQIQKILDQIEEKIQWLRDRAQTLSNPKDIEKQLQQLEKHKSQIEDELKTFSLHLRKRWEKGQPHLKEAGQALSKALKAILTPAHDTPRKAPKPKKSTAKKTKPKSKATPQRKTRK